MGAVLLLALALGDVRDARMPVVEDRADAIEHHTLYCEDGKAVFSQLIAWNFNGEQSRFECAAWRLWLPNKAVHAAESNGAIIWMDGETLRRLRYGSWRRSHTQGYDPEMADRERVPVDERKGLAKP